MAETYTSAGKSTDLAKDPLGTIEAHLESDWLNDTAWWTATNTALTAIRPTLGISTNDIHFGYYPEEFTEGRLFVWISEINTPHEEPDLPGMFTISKMFADIKCSVRDTEHHRRGHREPILVEMRAYIEKWVKQHKRAFRNNGITHIILQSSNVIEKDEISDWHDLIITIMVRFWKVSSVMI